MEELLGGKLFPFPRLRDSSGHQVILWPPHLQPTPFEIYLEKLWGGVLRLLGPSELQDHLGEALAATRPQPHSRDRPSSLGIPAPASV